MHNIISMNNYQNYIKGISLKLKKTKVKLIYELIFLVGISLSTI